MEDADRTRARHREDGAGSVNGSHKEQIVSDAASTTPNFLRVMLNADCGFIPLFSGLLMKNQKHQQPYYTPKFKAAYCPLKSLLYEALPPILAVCPVTLQ